MKERQILASEPNDQQNKTKANEINENQNCSKSEITKENANHEVKTEKEKSKLKKKI